MLVPPLVWAIEKAKVWFRPEPEEGLTGDIEIAPVVVPEFEPDL